MITRGFFKDGKRVKPKPKQANNKISDRAKELSDETLTEILVSVLPTNTECRHALQRMKFDIKMVWVQNL